MSWDYAVKLVPKQVGGMMRSEAQFVCRCGSIWSRLAPAGKKLNPEALAKQAREDGWEIDHRRASQTRCPACITKARKERRGESPYTTCITEPETTTMTVQPRDPTHEERMRIRAMLDKHFDDGIGCYLDGYSDEKIGLEVNVPAMVVTRIRETAYGPIRVDPEVAALRAELKRLDDQMKRLGADFSATAKRIDELAAKKAPR